MLAKRRSRIKQGSSFFFHRRESVCCQHGIDLAVISVIDVRSRPWNGASDRAVVGSSMFEKIVLDCRFVSVVLGWVRFSPG